nr:MAG: ORF1 [Torque teno midi virus]
MPFWWRRRKKNWWGKFQYKRRRNNRYKRRFPRRRKYRRPARRRRRRRRRYKVRRKKKAISIKQWQPESIRKCKIKTVGTLVMGAHGSQYKCYTNEAYKYPPPKEPSGGGFGVEVFSLSHLYNQYKAHKSIWTESNDYKDLARYTGCKFIFYRHATTDFLISYELQPPFLIDKFTYPAAHPVSQILLKKKKMLHSLKSKPYGPSKVVLKIKPPKMLSNKWFFQKQLAPLSLVKIQAAACDLRYANMGNTWASNMLTIYFLNTAFYQESNWGNAGLSHYLPYKTINTKLFYWYKDSRGNRQKIQVKTDTYYTTVNYTLGYFDTRVLNSYSITTSDSSDTEGKMAVTPIGIGRYNPLTDTGEGNELWAVSTLTEHYDHPSTDKTLIFKGYPLWLMFYGYKNYIEQEKGDPTFLNSYMFVFRCPSMQKVGTITEQDYYPFIDQSFLNGNMPYDEYLSDNNKRLWFPTIKRQLETINIIVTLGPYIPKYKDNRDSTWELNYKSIFYFKWGGPQITEKIALDPTKQGDYPIPNLQQTAVQVVNPLKQKYETMFHDWDFRRGVITKSALKRMYEHLETDSDVQTTSTGQAHKKRKITGEVPALPPQTQEIQDCLRSLFEEDTYQEEEDIQHILRQQHNKQQQLKHQLLQLIADLKQKQQLLQMQTGILS